MSVNAVRNVQADSTRIIVLLCLCLVMKNVGFPLIQTVVCS